MPLQLNYNAHAAYIIVNWTKPMWNINFRWAARERLKFDSDDLLWLALFTFVLNNSYTSCIIVCGKVSFSRHLTVVKWYTPCFMLLFIDSLFWWSISTWMVIVNYAGIFLWPLYKLECSNCICLVKIICSMIWFYYLNPVSVLSQVSAM